MSLSLNLFKCVKIKIINKDMLPSFMYARPQTETNQVINIEINKTFNVTHKEQHNAVVNMIVLRFLGLL